MWYNRLSNRLCDSLLCHLLPQLLTAVQQELPQSIMDLTCERLTTAQPPGKTQSDNCMFLRLTLYVCVATTTCSDLPDLPFYHFATYTNMFASFPPQLLLSNLWYEPHQAAPANCLWSLSFFYLFVFLTALWVRVNSMMQSLNSWVLTCSCNRKYRTRDLLV